ncbi:DUF2026 domain-containing protein [Aliivibrio finisterrensis]|nr:DUF2026 domain-containing protein [Aliivibrio finisterrensis]
MQALCELKEYMEMKITLPEYFRIYSVIHAVLISENADTNKACSFYNYCGAYILNQHYKMPAKVYSGFAGYHLGEDYILGFGASNGNQLSSSQDEFHTWVEVDGWLIDFMAPEFPNVLKGIDATCNVQRKMMQKPLDSMVENADKLTKAGDFLLLPNMDVTNAIMANMEKKPAYIDLIEICSRWYNKKPSKMLKEIKTSDGKGHLRTINTNGIKSLSGAW